MDVKGKQIRDIESMEEKHFELSFEILSNIITQNCLLIQSCVNLSISLKYSMFVLKVTSDDLDV